MKIALVPYNTARLGMFLSVLIYCIFFITYMIYSELQITRIEKSEALKSLKRVENLIRYKIRSIDSITTHYSQWDETWAYIQGKNPKFFQKNFSSQSMENLDIDFVALYGEGGQLLYAFHRLGKTLPWPTNARKIGSPFSSSTPILSGLYLFEALPVILSSQVITKANGAGPAVGRLIFGKELDKRVAQGLEELAGLPIDLRDLAKGESPLHKSLKRR